MINERATEQTLELAGEAPLMGSGEPAKSVLFVPLIVGGEATGRISLQNLDHEHAFSEADVRLLTTIAGSLSVALENARLFEETRQRNAELALINDVQSGLAENLEMQAMYDLVGDRIRDIFDAQVIAIGIVNRDTGLLDNPYMFEMGVPLHDRADVHRRRADQIRPRHWRTARHQRAVHGTAPTSSDPRRTGARAVIHCRPCTSLSSWAVRAIGRITLQNIDRENAFTERRRQPPDHARREPERRARQRPPVRRDPAAQRRARAHQRRAARTRREPRDAGDVRPRRRASRADLRCTDGRHRSRGHGRRSDLVPVLDRARRAADRPPDRDHGVPEDRAGDA